MPYKQDKRVLYTPRVNGTPRATSLRPIIDLFPVLQTDKTDEAMLGYTSFNVLALAIASYIGFDKIRYGKASLVPGVNPVNFSTPVASANWMFGGIPLCISAVGNIVLPDILSRTANGFTVDIGATGTIEYLIIQL